MGAAILRACNEVFGAMDVSKPEEILGRRGGQYSILFGAAIQAAKLDQASSARHCMHRS